MNDYKLIQWPEIQIFMDYPWFEEECCLANSEYFIEEYGSQAYFVPIDRLEQHLEKLNPKFDD